MGSKMFGFRSGKHLNDNLPKVRKVDDEVPIKPEDFRRPPTIEPEKDVLWYCLVTVPQGEYRCADALSEAGIASYVPTDTKWTKRRKGSDLLKVQVQVPVFRGYTFCRITRDEDWEPIYSRDAFHKSRIGVLSVIGNHGAPMPMPLRKKEIRDGVLVRCGLADFADDERAGWFDDRYRPGLIAGRDAKPIPDVLQGEEVRITGGPFSGYVGVSENDNDDRGNARVSVDLFGRATLMTVSLADLENLTRPKLASASLRRA